MQSHDCVLLRPMCLPDNKNKTSQKIIFFNNASVVIYLQKKQKNKLTFTLFSKIVYTNFSPPSFYFFCESG